MSNKTKLMKEAWNRSKRSWTGAFMNLRCKKNTLFIGKGEGQLSPEDTESLSVLKICIAQNFVAEKEAEVEGFELLPNGEVSGRQPSSGPGMNSSSDKSFEKLPVVLKMNAAKVVIEELSLKMMQNKVVMKVIVKSISEIEQLVAFLET